MDALYRLLFLWEVEAQKLNSEQNDNHFAKEDSRYYVVFFRIFIHALLPSFNRPFHT